MHQQTDTIVHRLFAALATSPEAFASFFTDDGEIVAVRPGVHLDHPLYGTHRGPEGIGRVLTSLGTTFEPEEFVVETVVETTDHAFAAGRLSHRVRATGRGFASEWALRLDLVGGRIRTYRFYEDSEALAEAMRP